MTILIHNTPRANAELILKQRRILASVEPHRRYDQNSGPFFYLEGQDGTELPGGGEPHEIFLYFACSLPLAGPFNRAAINAAIIAAQFDGLRGHIVIGKNDVSGTVEQAIIIPDERACLTLLRVEPAPKLGRLDRLLKRPADTRPFDVLLPGTGISGGTGAMR